MSFFAVLFALVIEQLKPLPRDNWVHDSLISWVGWTGRNFDAGRDRHAWVVWLVTVVAPGMVAPLGSFTKPVMVPKSDWANKATVASANRSAIPKILTCFMKFSLGIRDLE